MKIKASFFFLSALLATQSAMSCPPQVKAMKSSFLGKASVCEIHDRYQQAIATLRAKGIRDPESLGNLKAPRFIFRPDWLKARSMDPRLALSLYKPAPTTWLDWAAAANIVDREAKQNFRAGRLGPMSVEWLLRIHSQTMEGMNEKTGAFRNVPVLGPNIFAGSALNVEQASGVQSIKYQNALKPGTPLVSFTTVQCVEHRDEAFKAAFWENNKTDKRINSDEFPAVPDTTSFRGADGKMKKCGFIRYAAPEEIAPQLERWTRFINNATRSWGSTNPHNDPVVVAMHAQRWLVSIHPFENGNGRMSRFAMEWLLQSVGLPAPVIEDMNNDMYMTETQWAREIGIGIRRAIVEIESCARDLNQPGCQEIPRS